VADATSALVEAAVRALSPIYGDVRPATGRHRRLPGSDRARVIRLRLSGGDPDVVPRTVIIKSHVPAELADGGIREPAALEMLGELGVGVAPALLAVSSVPPLVVIEDLRASVGSVSLADLLLDRDPNAAAAGLMSWAEAMAALHGAAAATSGAEDMFTRFLQAHAARLGQPAPPAAAGQGLDNACSSLRESLPLLGIEPSAAAIDELLALDQLLQGGQAASVLTPADACPDNNAIGAERTVLFDFEGAEVRHVAWDAAYLVVPWPSCWCAWEMPSEVSRPALGRWRKLVAPSIPHVASAGFDEDLAAASIGWALRSIAWFLRMAVNPPPRRGSERERRIVAPCGRLCSTAFAWWSSSVTRACPR
jgi:hypothetical protein